MPEVSVEIGSPLRDCIIFCEIECVLPCCGIDAISTHPAHIEEWCQRVGAVKVVEARLQLTELMELLDSRTNIASEFLNHRVFDEVSRRALQDFLAAIDAGMAASEAP